MAAQAEWILAEGDEVKLDVKACGKFEMEFIMENQIAK
jgi:hypothetical protein